MATRVIIFGAGASKTAGTPLMREFIDAAEDVLRTEPQAVSKDAFELVFELIRNRLPLLHAKSVVDLSNIESVFNIIEMARLVGRLPATPENEIERASDAIRTVLTETIERTCRFHLTDDNGWVPSWEYLALAEHISSAAGQADDAYGLVSFNYDFALDYALHRSELLIDYGLAAHDSGSVPLMKLHGSLNWVTCSCGAVVPIPVASLFRSVVSQRGRPADGRFAIPVRPAYPSVPAHCDKGTIVTQPAIVPPSWNKTQYQRAFRGIWRRAAEEISQATEITVIGYSLPQTDSFFRELLSLGLVGSTRLRRITVVDPDPKVADRFLSLLGPEARGRFEHTTASFEEWVKQAFPGPPISFV